MDMTAYTHAKITLNWTHKDNISTWNISYLFGTLPSPYRVSKAVQHIIKSSNIFAVADINNNLKEDDLIMQIYFSRITKNYRDTSLIFEWHVIPSTVAKSCQNCGDCTNKCTTKEWCIGSWIMFSHPSWNQATER